MSIDVECSACGKTGRVPDDYAGRRIQCPGCQNVITVPGADGCAIEASPAALVPPPLPMQESVVEKLRRGYESSRSGKLVAALMASVVQEFRRGYESVGPKRAAIAISCLVAAFVVLGAFRANSRSIVGYWQFDDSDTVFQFTTTTWNSRQFVLGEHLPYSLRKNILQLEARRSGFAVYRTKFVNDDLLECQHVESSDTIYPDHFVLRRLQVNPNGHTTQCPECGMPAELEYDTFLCSECQTMFPLIVKNGRLSPDSSSGIRPIQPPFQ